MKGSFVHIVELKMSRTGDTSDFDGHDFYDFTCSSRNAPFCDGFSTTILDIGQRISILCKNMPRSVLSSTKVTNEELGRFPHQNYQEFC